MKQSIVILALMLTTTTGCKKLISGHRATATIHSVVLSATQPVQPVGETVTSTRVYKNGALFATVAASATPSYTDAAVVAGSSYTYYMTNVDSMAIESIPSNVITAIIPVTPPPPPPPLPPTVYPYNLGSSTNALSFKWAVGNATPLPQSVTTWDSSPCPPPNGVPTCHWPVTATTDKPWLVVVPSSGTTSFITSISINTSSLSAGT